MPPKRETILTQEMNAGSIAMEIAQEHVLAE